MKIKQELHYSSQHLWVQQLEGDVWQAGITDYAQDLLGDVVFVEFPAVGQTIQSGTPCGLVESVKTGSDLHAPMDGVVVELNAALESTPELLNDRPYDTWIFKFRSESGADKHLLSAIEYEALLGAS